ncbi:tetratricopeptide repeat protein [Leptospira wolffii]|uniref:tetratricopeptide repeat protein n=1 Tax=Leptospira wolffii TaxID=409998 RepID=UPI0003128AE6|nr:tetratricopeptide repeat protein [Leptospira wolffii]EPG67178.1 tetratricopeptide repeat protein [Leptospira wolffii serovar Khorat str. Khorat-H2]
MKSNLILILSFLSILTGPAYSFTVGVADIKTFDPNTDIGKISDSLQQEIQKGKQAVVRDRKSIESLLEYFDECSSGIRKCSSDSSPDIKGLDVIVFAELFRTPLGYSLSVRAVRESSWTVFAVSQVSGKDPEDLIREAGAEINESFRAVNEGKIPLNDSDSISGKYTLAIHEIRMANEDAERANLGGRMDSVLGSVFGKKSNFVLVERARTADLAEEKKLSLSGLARTNRKEFEIRGITHFLTGSLKVFDGIYVLSYQINSVKTGLPILSDIVEWSDEKELEIASNELVKSANRKIFEENGKLFVHSCDVKDAIVTLEKQGGGVPDELGHCPISIEDLPPGKYVLSFYSEEKDTLTMQIEIRPTETVNLDSIRLPPIDLSLLKEASDLEYQENYQRSLEKYRAFYGKYPKHRLSSYALYREGFILQINLHKYDEGKAVLQEVLNRNPDASIRTEAYYGIALGLRKQGLTEDGDRILKMLAEEYPGSIAAEAAKECLTTRSCSL